MRRQYFNTPKYAVPINHRCFSSNTSLLVIRSFYPQTAERVDAGFKCNGVRWHAVTPTTEHKDLSKPVAMLFADPIVRFFASCRKDQISSYTIPLTLANQEKKWCSFHFWPQSRFLAENEQPIYLFKFPNDLQKFCDFIGANKQYLPEINSKKFTDEQLNFIDRDLDSIVEAYEDDFSVYNALLSSKPGILFSDLSVSLNRIDSYGSKNNYLTLLRY